MVDLHCHILPEVDDGSRSMEETLQLLERAANAGFTKICFTPHYAEPVYLNNKIKNEQILQEIQARVKEENIPIQLFLGNEVFINGNMDELLKNGEISTLGDSRYLLIELPMYQELPPEIMHKMLDSVRQQQIQIVIAHPERYTYIQENPEKLLQYFPKDVIFQANYGSIIGSYGKSAQKTLKELLKMKIIHYLASDTHHLQRCFYDRFDVIRKKFLKEISHGYWELICEENPRLVLQNREVVNPK